MRRWIEGEVSILHCLSCGRRTPHLTFVGDTDMVTMGLTSLSSITHNEIVVAEAQSHELLDADGGAIVGRVSALLERDDLRFVRPLRSKTAEVKAGLSFQAFREEYQPPFLIFSCPHCVVGEAEIESPLSLDAFRREGGKLTVLPDLEVRGCGTAASDSNAKSL